VYGRRFYRSLDQFDRAASLRCKRVLDVLDHAFNLLVRQVLDHIALLDLVLTRDQQSKDLEIGRRLRAAHFRNRLLPVLTEIAQERANDLLAQLVTRAAQSSGRVALPFNRLPERRVCSIPSQLSCVGVRAETAMLARLPMLEIAIILIVGFALGYVFANGFRADGTKRRGSDAPLGGSQPPGRHLAVDLYGSGVIGGRRQDHESSHSGAFGTPGVVFSAIPISGIAAGTFSRTR